MPALYRYSGPATIHWGRGSIAQLTQEIGEGARVALVTTRSLADGPVMSAVRAALMDRQAEPVVIIGQHAPEADVEAAVSAIAAAGARALVSLGGGSPIDAAKIVSVRLGGLPHVAVPTTLSAAELAAGAGYSDAAGNKVGLRDPAGMPRAAIYDPQLALHTPLELWLSTGIRSLDHAVEGFLSPGEHPYNDVLCLEAVRRLFDSLPRALSVPMDVEVRGQNQLAAWLSYSLPASAVGLSHVMGKQIGARFGIPHGVTSCILLPHVLGYRLARQADRAEPLAAAMGGDPAVRVGELVLSLGLPRRLAPYGLNEDDLRSAAAALAGPEHSIEDLASIYLAAL
ncbi:MAG TPA: iron-containing alcohol dehydrogenase [Candidatus Dormibacteraeota bacterium]